MKAILLDPSAEMISEIDLHPRTALVNAYFSEKPKEIARLPKGDVLLAGGEDTDAFVIGGMGPIAGPGLIVGRRIGPGERGPALVKLDDVIKMVRWTSVERSECADKRAKVRAIAIDPERESIEEVLITPTLLAAQRLMGCEVRVCFRAPGGDRVLAARGGPRDVWHWKKDDMLFGSRCLVVGHDSRTDRFVDVATSLENLRSSVQFQRPGESRWIGYEDRAERGTK
jgi:hypothetical protein